MLSGAETRPKASLTAIKAASLGFLMPQPVGSPGRDGSISNRGIILSRQIMDLADFIQLLGLVVTISNKDGSTF